MNVLVAGLTGAGKTTLSKSLSKALDLMRISASEVRYREISPDTTDAPTPTELREAWLGAEFDSGRGLDDHLVELNATLSDIIFDSWLLPWISRTPSFAIWLEVPLEVRAKRLEADIQRSKVPADAVENAVRAKDERARQYALMNYSIDIAVDRTPFDIILRIAANGGVRATSRILEALTRAALYQTCTHLSKEDADLMSDALIRCPPELIDRVGKK
jgi:cytidylate kinase